METRFQRSTHADVMQMSCIWHTFMHVVQVMHTVQVKKEQKIFGVAWVSRAVSTIF